MLIRTHALRLAVFAALGIPGGVLGSSCGGDAPDGGGGSVSHPLPACSNPTPIKDAAGQDSGFVKCADGSIDRTKTVSCSGAVPACSGSEDEIDCMTDADCAGTPNSRCGHSDGDEFSSCGCIAVCKSDADCAANEACVCDGAPGNGGHAACVPAGCRGPADCESHECGLDIYHGCDAVLSLACRDLEADACRADADCGSGKGCVTLGGAGTSPAANRTCEIEGCDGRLLRGQAGLVSASSTRRSDWAAGRPCATSEDLPDATRRALADHWSKVAATEHAAVASFARFSLQLLANGAPPEFLAASQRAAAEEIEHARRAYAIASGFAGEAIGPGPLDACRLPLDATRRGLIEGLVDDACVSELVNVTEVLALASVATDPAVRAFAEQTADEEAAHVALAWRVLRWALEGAGAAERGEARRRLEARIVTLHAVEEVAIAAPGHGLLGRSERLEIRRRALRDVAVPAVATLFSGLAGFDASFEPEPARARA